jgi:hypothetical protein
VKLCVLSTTNTKTIPPCVGKERLGVSGYERGSYDGHRDKPTTSTKAVVRVTRVIDEIPISRGLWVHYVISKRYFSCGSPFPVLIQDVNSVLSHQRMDPQNRIQLASGVEEINWQRDRRLRSMHASRSKPTQRGGTWARV